MDSILIKAGTLIGIIAAGYLLKLSGFFRVKDARLLSKIVLNITLPCAILSNFARCIFEPQLLWLIPIHMAFNAIYSAAGYLAEHGQGRAVQAFGVLNYSGSNIGCFSIPYAQSFLGADGLLAVSIMDIGNTVSFFGGSCTVAQRMLGNQGEMSLWQSIRSILTAPLIVCLVMLGVIVTGLRVPEDMLTVVDTVGNANVFLSMLMIGIAMDLHPDHIKLRQIVRMLLVRYGIGLVLCFTALKFAPFSMQTRSAIALIAIAPVPSSAVGLTIKLDCDASLASTWNSISTLMSLIMMLGLMILLS